MNLTASAKNWLASDTSIALLVVAVYVGRESEEYRGDFGRDLTIQ
jgi:hypothetical protein